MAECVDYVIVGAGTAGCLLAARLSQDPDVTVTLLEFGGTDSNPAIWSKDVKSLFRLWAPNAAENWGYRTVQQPGLNDRTIDIARGRVLGGCSAINAMIYIRGNRRDFDRWQQLGNRGWSYDEILPYFKKSEKYHGPPSAYHGHDGPMSVIDYSHPSPVSHAFIEAAAELGRNEKYNDLNGAIQEAGAGFYQSTRTPAGIRVTAASAFVTPNLERKNLRLRTNARATRLLFDGRRVVGVEYRGHDRIETIRAEREVVLCCGAFETPKLMMLSGLGAAEQLASRDIAVVEHLPGVGKNLQDHLMLGVGFASKIPLRAPELLAEAGLFTWTDGAPRRLSPDLQYFFGPLQFLAPEYMTNDPGFTFAPILAQPQSRGMVTLASSDPAALARVDMNYLSRDEDIAVLEYGIRYARELAHTKAFETLRGRELAPGKEVTTSSELRDFIRRVASTVWHACGTCKMGTDQDAVVDDELKVHGVQGLRIVDASVMPHLVNGNPNAAIMMIAEKAADLITFQPTDSEWAVGWASPLVMSDDLGTTTDVSSPTSPAWTASRLSHYRDKVAPVIRGSIQDRQPKKHLYDLIFKQLGREGTGIGAAICLATCGAFGGSEAQALPSAAAIELLHRAFAVHEDIAEESIPLAINVGDAMNALSVRLLNQNLDLLGPELAARVFREFDRISVETTEGRAMDLGWMQDNDCSITEEDYLLIVLKKASLSFIQPARIGALIAQPGRTNLDDFNSFGYYLGAAFQIQNDLVSLACDRKSGGTKTGGHSLDGKQTLLLAHLLRNAKAQDADRVKAFFGRPTARRSHGARVWVDDFLRTNGSIEYANKTALAFAEGARRAFERAYSCAPQSGDLDFVRSLPDYVIGREA